MQKTDHKLKDSKPGEFSNFSLEKLDLAVNLKVRSSCLPSSPYLGDTRLHFSIFGV